MQLNMKNKREAFSMMMALFVMVIMSSIAIMVMSTSGKIIQETTAQYQREQSMLLAESYTEYAILAVTANEHNSTNCLNDITGAFGIYNITVNISYLGMPNSLDASCTRVITNTIATTTTPLSIIVDVFVRYDVLDHPSSTPPSITYHKRSLQKI